jgi:hypothetical protein
VFFDEINDKISNKNEFGEEMTQAELLAKLAKFQSE